MGLFETLFGRTHDLNGWQECARAALVFAYGLLLVRLSGRRTFGKWSALDIVVSIVLGSSLSRALTGSAPLIGTMAACAVLLLLHWAAAQVAARSPAVARLLEGTPIVIVRDGAVLHRPRLRQSVSHADLDEALRQAGMTEPAEAAKVVLEPSGKLTVRRDPSHHARPEVEQDHERAPHHQGDDDG